MDCPVSANALYFGSEALWDCVLMTTGPVPLARWPQKVQFDQGKKLADEFGIKFFETSAKEKINVDEAFLAISKDIVRRSVACILYGAVS